MKVISFDYISFDCSFKLCNFTSSQQQFYSSAVKVFAGAAYVGILGMKGSIHFPSLTHSFGFPCMNGVMQHFSSVCSVNDI